MQVQTGNCLSVFTCTYVSCINGVIIVMYFISAVKIFSHSLLSSDTTQYIARYKIWLDVGKVKPQLSQ